MDKMDFDANTLMRAVQIWDKECEKVSKEISHGISKTTFIVGLIVAIIASSALSTVIATQLAVGPQGPKGDKGDTGPQGLQGEQGPPGVWGAPDYDSGWMRIDMNERLVLTHNLNTTNILVYLIGKQIMGADTPLLIHQLYYGWGYDPTLHSYMGATWYIPFPDAFPVSGDPENQIVIYRAPWDGYWHEVRALIWKIPESTP